MRWDLFCRVIDNYGDIGVCWRLAAELAARGDTVRLWVEDASALAWLCPEGHPGVTVVPWQDPLPALEPGDAVVEAFGCDPPESFVAAMAARSRPPAWINLEYLSAEGYVERSHRLPSPVSSGPGAGLTKHFFYPGFTERTGGLLREQDLDARLAAFDRDAWLRGHGVAPEDAGRVIALFCYEPLLLSQLLWGFGKGEVTTTVLVAAGRSADAVQAITQQLDWSWPGWNAAGRLRLVWLPWLSQREFDHLLWAADLDFVRGEDSVVRALLAGRPLVWQLYPQEDGAHLAKLQAFLARLAPPDDLARFHLCWNDDDPHLSLPELDLAGWSAWAGETAVRLRALPELAAELRSFCRERLE